MKCWLYQSILLDAQRDETDDDDHAESNDSCSSCNFPVHPTFAALKGPQSRIFIKNVINPPQTIMWIALLYCLPAEVQLSLNTFRWKQVKLDDLGMLFQLLLLKDPSQSSFKITKYTLL